MRDIKFRVIDENGEIYGFERLRNGRWERATAEDMPWEAGTFHIIAIREQSTGLKTKNGVDLDWWEGDTLKSPDGERAIIVYNTLGAGFYAKRPQDNYFWLPIYKAWKQGWSRIGNIHEEKP